MADVYLDTALADFSGYLAIDEAYDGPFCILSIVDHRRYNRLAFQVLDHDPTQDDVRVFLQEFKGQLSQRGLAVLGITTDGSSLYPPVLQELWPDAPPQVVRVPHPQGDHQGGAARRGETAQGVDGEDPQAAARPAPQSGAGAGATGRPAEATGGGPV